MEEESHVSHYVPSDQEFRLLLDDLRDALKLVDEDSSRENLEELEEREKKALAALEAKNNQGGIHKAERGEAGD